MSEQDKNPQGTPIARIEPAKVPQEEAVQNLVQNGDKSPDDNSVPGRPEGISNAEGLKSFIKNVIKPDASQQHPDKTAKSAAGSPESEKRRTSGLFDAMNAPLRGLAPEELRFADEVDAALSRRPRYGARLLSIAVAAMFVILIAWAALADVDEVTHAEGQVVGSQRTQTIQNLEGGIVRSIQVHEGQIVEKGALLAQLDNEVAESSFRDAISKAIENSLALVRLESELHDREPEFPTDLRRWLASRLRVEIDSKILSRATQMLADQVNVWRKRKDQLEADIHALEAQLSQREHEIDEESARLRQLRESLSLAIQQRNTGAELLRRKNFAKMEYLNLESKVVELRGQIDQIESTIPKLKAAAQEIRKKIASREAEQKVNITQEIDKRRLELTSLRETLSAGADRVARTELRAPVRGTIRQVYINTVGGVVKPGEPIMDLVPLDDTLLIEARVPPKDVAFLRPGQDVMVKISAYDFSIYGGLEGKLESISADTIEDRRGDFYYVVKVRTRENAISHNNELLPIIPGMMATADILTGKKTILDYVLKPILKARQNALRER